jgi:hypothetical protein
MVRSALFARVSNHESVWPSFETRRAVKFTQTAYTCLRGAPQDEAGSSP